MDDMPAPKLPTTPSRLPAHVPTPPASEILGVLARGAVRCDFQPIVDLDTRAVVAYEALARGPQGALERPDVLFAAARSAGRLAQLDELCRRTALNSAVTQQIRSPLALFINVEPQALRLAALDELLEIADASANSMQLVLEVTERALAAQPAELLATVRRLRSAGWRIALDDVGADDLSLAFMSVLRPDILKIDMGVVQRRPDAAVAMLMNAINAHAERSGCLVLAEGIEDESHLAQAHALGATLGQGWMFGRPHGTVPPPMSVAPLQLAPAVFHGTTRTPFGLVPPSTPTRVSRKPLLIQVSKHLERQAGTIGPTCVVLSAFQAERYFTPATQRRYHRLREQVGFVAVMGTDLLAEPMPGVRGASLDINDPLCMEWDIVVISPHFAAALIARDIGDAGPDADRRFEFVLTYDRDTVVAAAESLIARVHGTTG
jgi:EAL domain-containing protein (putative c-di-GMP-specific phosphodiesterase class I)